MITVLEPGKLVKIEPDKLDATDILELAEALIREHGWKQGDSGNEKEGWSLHGAIGEAARLATQSHQKDSDYARPLRDEATDLVQQTRPGQTDLTINDSAQTVDEVFDVLREAREAHSGENV